MVLPPFSPSKHDDIIDGSTSFAVSAPGKIIISGEYSVLYGKVLSRVLTRPAKRLLTRSRRHQTAIAAAIPLRSVLFVQTLPAPAKDVTLYCPDIGLNYTWNMAELPWGIMKRRSSAAGDLRQPKWNSDIFSLLVTYVTAVSASSHPDEVIQKRRLDTATAFLYLFLSTMSPSSYGSRYVFQSNIPVASGQGSSASFSVCVATALLLQAGHIRCPYIGMLAAELHQAVGFIQSWALLSEACIHQTPSGLDTAVATLGGMVWFQPAGSETRPTLTLIRSKAAMHLLLIHTKQKKQSTAKEVERVYGLQRDHPVVLKSIMDAIGEITSSLARLMTSKKIASDNDTKLFGELLSMNQSLLTALGATYPRINELCDVINNIGLGWTKITGAGGEGGSSITLISPDTSSKTLIQLKNYIADNNYESRSITVGYEAGVGVLVDHDGTRKWDETTVASLFPSNCISEGRWPASAELGNLKDGVLPHEQKKWHFWRCADMGMTGLGTST